jgi:hypothetical protein
MLLTKSSRWLPASACLPPDFLPAAAVNAACPQARAPLEKKLAEEPQFMAALEVDIQALAAELAALGVADS